MQYIDKVKSFLQAMEYARHISRDVPPPLSHPFITLSRQAGAGGHSLAETVMKEIERESSVHPLFQGWHIFDSEMCQKVLEVSKLHVPLESLVNDEFHSQIEDALYQLLTHRPPQDAVLHKIFRAIRMAAHFGKVIVIGRGGVCVTRHLPLGIHLRLVAPLEDRISRMMPRWQLSEKETRAKILAQDDSRAELFRHYFGCHIDDPLLYHVVWNTAAVPVQEMARLVMAMIEARREVVQVPDLEHHLAAHAVGGPL